MGVRDRLLFKFINFWPPFWGAGIHVDSISDDFKMIDVSMKLTFWNRNYVKTHFGGSLYSMTDPFYMLMLMQLLGPNYIVWDKGATIRFIRPGRSKVFAKFLIEDQKLDELKVMLEESDKIEPVFRVLVIDDDKQIVAEIDKVLYIRKKPQKGSK